MFIKRLTVVGVIFSMLLLASGCQLFAGDSISTADVFKTKIATKTGFYGEKFIPKDAAVVGAFDMQDSTQGAAFDKLRAKFVDDQQWTKLKEDGYAEINEELKEDGMNFKNDILDVFGQNPRFVVAVDKKAMESLMGLNMWATGLEAPVGNVKTESSADYPVIEVEDAAASSEKEPQTGSALIQAEDQLLDISAATGSDQNEFEGTVYFVAKIDNVDKFNNLMKYLDEKKSFDKVEGQDMDVWQEDEVFVGRYQDMMVVTNSLESWKSAVQRAKKSEDNITDNEVFQTVFEKIGYPHVMYLYEDSQASLEATISGMNKSLEDASETEKELIKKMEDFYRKNMGFITGDAFAMVLEDGGVRFKTYGYADEDKLKGDDQGFAAWKGELTLVNKLPGKGMMFYEEIGAGVVNMVGDLVGSFMYSGLGLNVDGFKEQFKAVTGLDWDKDIAAFAKKNIAFYVADAGEILPAMGIALDASADPAAAGRTMEVLNSTIDVGLASLKAGMTEDQAKVLEKKKVNLAGKDVYKVGLDVSKLSEESLAVLSLDDTMRTAKMELNYGVTGDNVALIAFHPGFDKAYGKETLANSEEYKKALAAMGKDYQDGVLIYFNTTPIWSYVDRFFKFVESMPQYDDAGNEIEVEDPDKKVYEEFKKYAKPVKYFIMGAKMSKTENQGSGYLSIE